jgi:hypothetical protein
VTTAEPAKRVGARAGQPFPRLMVLHHVEGHGPYWHATRYIVGPMGIVSRDESRPSATSEAAAEWARGDATRIAATLARIRGQVEKHADECDRDAQAILAEVQKQRAESAAHRKEAVRLREAAEASRTKASTLLSAIEAAQYRILGGKRVAVAGMQPKDMVRAEAIPARESEEARTQILLTQAAEADERAAGIEADEDRMQAQAAQRMERATELRAQARKDGDDFIMKQRGREFTW